MIVVHTTAENSGREIETIYDNCLTGYTHGFRRLNPYPSVVVSHLTIEFVLSTWTFVKCAADFPDIWTAPSSLAKLEYSIRGYTAR